MNYGLDIKLRYVFEDEECTAAFDRLVPGLRSMTEKKRDILGMSIRSVAGYAKGMLSGEVLDALEAELKAIGERNNGISPAERRRMEHYQTIRAKEQAKEDEGPLGNG